MYSMGSCCMGLESKLLNHSRWLKTVMDRDAVNKGLIATDKMAEEHGPKH